MSTTRFESIDSKLYLQNISSSSLSRSISTVPSPKGFGSQDIRFHENVGLFDELPGPGSYFEGVSSPLIINSPSLSRKGFNNAFASKTTTGRSSTGKLQAEDKEDPLPFITTNSSVFEMDSSSLNTPSIERTVSRSHRHRATSSFANKAPRTPFEIPPRYKQLTRLICHIAY
jgi:hypothetical protein